MRFRLPVLTLATALLVTLPLLAAPPAGADFAGYSWQSTRIYSPATGNFAAVDTALVRLPDGSFLELAITQEANADLPTRVVAWAGTTGSWGQMEFPDGAGDAGTPLELDAFVTPGGGVVAVWLVSENGQAVYRTSARAPGGGWSAPTELFTGSTGALRELFPGPTGATLVWEDHTEKRVYSRTWSAGAWAAAVAGPGGAELPTYGQDYATAVRPSDGQITIAYRSNDEPRVSLRIARLDPGGEWTTITSHQTVTPTGAVVGVKDQYGNIRAIVELTHLDEVAGMVGATYDPDGDLHLWWNNRRGETYVEGVYPNYSIYCACERGVSGMVAPGGDLEARAFETVLPGLPPLPDGRSIRQVWDADGDRTLFVGGQGDYYGQTVNFYREGDTFGSPRGSFLAPGTQVSSRSGFVSATFVSGDDILVGYQHSAPASNAGPGGSCNTRLLSGNDELSGFLNICFDGNTDDWSALQTPDGSVYLGSSSGRYVQFGRWAPDGATAPVAAVVGVAWPSLSAGVPASVGVSVTGAGTGQAATGIVRLRYDGASVDVRPLVSGTATLSLPGARVAPGNHNLRVEYDGSPGVLAGFAQTTVTVGQVAPPAPAPTVRTPPRTPTVKVRTAPTPKKKGRAVVKAAAPSAGLPTPGGQVTVTLTKGDRTKQVTGTLAAGAATVTLPRLAKGTWRLSVAYAGDATYLPAVSTTTRVKVGRQARGVGH